VRELLVTLILGLVLGIFVGALGYAWWSDADRLNLKYQIESLKVDRELSQAYKTGLAATGRFYQERIDEINTSGHCADAVSSNSRLLLEADRRGADAGAGGAEVPTGYTPSNADSDAWAIRLREALEVCRNLVFARNERNQKLRSELK
jgi:hypothetical protein